MKKILSLACACAFACAWGVETEKFEAARDGWKAAETELGSLRLAPMFRDGAVFAKNRPVRVFGTCAKDGVVVSVALNGKRAEARSANGRWLVELPAMPAGGPYELVVSADGKTATLKDVHVGWVILAAGQSNMAFKLKESDTPKKFWKDDPLLRSFSLPRVEKGEPHAPADGWVRCTAADAGNWSAIGYLLGRDVRIRTREAVGIVNCYQGASAIQAWIPEAVAREPRFALKPEERHADWSAADYAAWNKEGVLYALDVEPFAPFAVSHVAWYQGESNTGKNEARVYGPLCEALVATWRAAFKDPALPFTMVEIADFNPRKDDAWRAIQRVQREIGKKIPGVKTVRCADFSDPAQIHPPAKAPLALRIAEKVYEAAAKDEPRRGKTKVMLFFDTEDFTCDKSSDAIRDLAKIMTEEGVVGEFNIVGLLAREIVRNKRQDVIDALKPHGRAIGTQTYGHSLHPTICEKTDMPDYRVAYRNALRDESLGVGMLEAAFGLDHVDYAVPPGNSWSYASLYAFADMGMHFYGGGGFEDAGGAFGLDGLAPAGNRHWDLWYCNLRQIPYSCTFAFEDLMPFGYLPEPVDVDALLDRVATRDAVVWAFHPHMALKKAHWDGPNYARGNLVEWGKWKMVEDWPDEVTQKFYRDFRAFLKRVKADGRFVFTDISEMRKTIKPRVAIAKKDVPAIRKALATRLGPIHEPASWCVADAFQAAVAFLRGDAAFTPGKAYGFLERPRGVVKPTRVSAAGLKKAAAELDCADFIPPAIRVGQVEIGPADFLYAALEVLETGAATVTVRPREQLGDFDDAPGLEHVDLYSGWPIHAKSMNNDLLNERLKLQLWTLRFE